MSTTQPPAGRAPGAARSPALSSASLAPPAITTAGRDVLDKAAPVLAAIAREYIASRLPDTDPGQLTQALRTIAGTSPPEASQRRGDHISTAAGPMTTGSAAAAGRPQISAGLPVSDWQIRWRLQPDGRTVLEVTDQAGNLTGLVASTRLPIVSVDGAWRGTRRSADGSQQRWALAIGHASTLDRPLTVTFTHQAHRTTIHPATVDGLWVAAVTGHYTAVRCQTPAAASALQLMPVTTGHRHAELRP